jgi:putative solute:sodium symporter small subunit
MALRHLGHRAPRIRSHWDRTRRLTLLLMAIWFAVSIVVIFFARELAGMTFFGWPFSFYMAAQGSVLVYLALIGIYAWRMHRIDQEATGRDHDG